MPKKPIIGITPSPTEDVANHGTFRRYGLSSTYVDAVRAAGGLPIILPESETDLDSILGIVDGLVLSGGSDLAPRLYGDAYVHETTYGIDPERDNFEIELIRLAVKRDIPVLGICRGIQSINVALGGTLIQDIATEHPGNIGHRQHELGKSQTDLSHTVTIVDEQSPLSALIGKNTLAVNSFHHQSVRELARDLRVAAVADDGIIESLWHPGMTFGLAVQWHPEMLVSKHEDHAALFRALIAASSRAGVPAV